MKRLLRLTIPSTVAKRPIIYEIVTKYNLKPNIIEADLAEDHTGKVILELDGQPIDLERGILYLKELDIEVESLE
ncbi:MAG: hypothetical protein D6767_02725 [Candidatus Hydrogenedentota bacterium]|nr:MAG: hypothetical protein D6767_02725 [Candidatus Hydrogenedentota bacterium]